MMPSLHETRGPLAFLHQFLCASPPYTLPTCNAAIFQISILHSYLDTFRQYLCYSQLKHIASYDIISFLVHFLFFLEFTTTLSLLISVYLSVIYSQTVGIPNRETSIIAEDHAFLGGFSQLQPSYC